MSSRIVSLMATAAALVAVLAPVPAAGQEDAPNAKKHLEALPAQLITPSRTPDGQPDLQGAWRSRGGGVMHSIEQGFDPTTALFHGWNVRDLYVNVLVDPMRGSVPNQAWTQERRTRELIGHFMPTKREDIEGWLRCLAPGVPRATMQGTTIRQLPGYVLFIDTSRTTRIIPLDGPQNTRPHVDENLKLWMGDSRGHWEGNTLVVETTNNNDETEFDAHGNFHSDALHVVERLTMIDADTMYYEAAIQDPTVFTQPWKIALTWNRNKRPEKPWENVCYGEAAERNNLHTIEAGKRAKAAGITGIHIHDPNNITTSYAPAVPLTEEEKALAPPSTLKGLPPKYSPDQPPPIQAPPPACDYATCAEQTPKP